MAKAEQRFADFAKKSAIKYADAVGYSYLPK